jgi:hypothetical protein
MEVKKNCLFYNRWRISGVGDQKVYEPVQKVYIKYTYFNQIKIFLII